MLHDKMFAIMFMMQAMTVVISAATAVLSYKIIISCNRSMLFVRQIFVNSLIYLAHLLIYYASYFIFSQRTGIVYYEFFVSWSAGLRVHNSIWLFLATCTVLKNIQYVKSYQKRLDDRLKCTNPIDKVK